jgi:hypothetical protein
MQSERGPPVSYQAQGLVVVSFDYGSEFAKQFADARFEKGDAFMKEVLSKHRHD